MLGRVSADRRVLPGSKPRFTDPFREEDVDLAIVQGEWRELGACMRSMSHALQVCIVVLALTVGTGLIAVAFDVLRDGFALTMLRCSCLPC